MAPQGRHCVALALSLVQVVSWTSAPRPARFRWRGVSQRAVEAEVELADPEVDVAVVGGGPAGYTVAALLAATHGRSVALVDPEPEALWPNNYGEWKEEWVALSKLLDLPELLDCVRNEWAVTDCFFGGSYGDPWDQRTRLDRAYVQVDRIALKELLRSRIQDSGNAIILPGRLNARLKAPNLFRDDVLLHDASGSTLQLSTGKEVRAKMVVDATGFESRLVARQSPEAAGLWQAVEPGYQIAYGFTCEIKGSCAPYDTGAMTLFDYRTDHFASDPAWAEDAESRPTFVYAMPQGRNARGNEEVFFEETSLVGRGDRRLSFAECKRRAMRRLDHLGISIVDGSIAEEEFCYIPMGGALPDLGQRVVAVGGAAATVHPSTGYQLCRMLASAPGLTKALADHLGRPDFDPDAAAAAAYSALWPAKLRLQRDFQVYGGEFLMRQPVHKLRGFFKAFFAAETLVWGGFLAGWPGLPGNEYHETWDRRLSFALNLFTKMPNDVRLAMVVYAVRFSLAYGPCLLRSLATPLFQPLDDGATPPSSPTYTTGDTAAKEEALAILRDSPTKGTLPSPQVAELVDELPASPRR